MTQTTLQPSLKHSGNSGSACRWWMLLLIAFVAMAAYANSMRNNFAFDDVAVVENNPRVLDLEWTKIWSDNYWARRDGRQVDMLYRPLTIWTYLANQAIAPGAAWSFHLTNVVLNGLVSALVAVLAQRLLNNRAVALVTGLLFAVHPLHTEAVANTVGRAEILASLWLLLALLVFLPTEGLLNENAPTRRPFWHGLLVGACFFAALLSKETPASMACAFVFIDLWRWARWSRDIRPAWWKWLASQSFRYYLPIVVATCIYLLMRQNACGGLMASASTVHPIVNLLANATVAQRIITPFMLLAKYVGLTFWPVHLSADYSAPSLLPSSNIFEPVTLTGILTCILLLIFCIRGWRKYPQLLLIVGIFFISYALVANIIRIGTIFGERLFYWPSAFVLMLVSWALVSIYRAIINEVPARVSRAGLATAAWILLAIPMALMVARTYVRNTDWSDNVTLAIATARDNPGSSKACAWAGGILIIQDQRPEFVEFGKELLDRAVELAPYYPDVHWELAKYYGLHKDLPHSVIEMCIAGKLEPGTHLLRNGMTAVLTDFRMVTPDVYMPAFDEYQEAHPNEPAVHLARALALHSEGKFDEGEAEATIALKMGADTGWGTTIQYHEAAAEIGGIRFDKGDFENAVVIFRKYVAAQPNCIDARCEMIAMLMSLDHEKYPQAMDEVAMNIARAEKIDPNFSHLRELKARIKKLETTTLAREKETNPAQGITGVVP